MSTASFEAPQAAPKAKPSSELAARIEALIRHNAGRAEIVAFSDPGRPSVKVVRGGKARPAAAVEPGIIGRPAGRVEIVSFAGRLLAPVTVLRGAPPQKQQAAAVAAPVPADVELFGAARDDDLDRIAFAVDGAESSHGADAGMWRPEFAGPQGPMQVSAAAAIDSGGGDRFDLMQNRLLGRAYLARLYRRYGNWPDAVAAYNWGPGNLDAWIAQGRPVAGLPLAVERYRARVLRDGDVLHGPAGSSLPAIVQVQAAP